MIKRDKRILEENEKMKNTVSAKINKLSQDDGQYYGALVFMCSVIVSMVLLTFPVSTIAINFIFKNGISNEWDTLINKANNGFAFFIEIVVVVLIAIIVEFKLLEIPHAKKWAINFVLGFLVSFIMFIGLFPIKYIVEKQELFVSEVVFKEGAIDSIKKLTDEDGVLFQKNERKFIVEIGKEKKIVAVSHELNKDGSFDYETFELDDSEKTIRLNGWDYTIER